MRLFSTSQIRQLDRYTIEHEPIESIDLMERAADVLLGAVMHQFSDKASEFLVLAGPGNNGGDALALARKLKENGYEMVVHLYHAGKLSDDCAINKNRLQKLFPELLVEHVSELYLPEISHKTILIDGLFGSGLSRPLDGVYAELIAYINQQNNIIVAIDVPSGLNADGCNSITNPIVKADFTLSLQFPKLAFFYPENEQFIGEWSVLDIGLHPDGIAQMATDFYFLQDEDVRTLLHKRSTFSHKGTFGHLVLIAGSKGMAGAAMLSAQAALRSGVGLLTIFGTEDNRIILQETTPEAMYHSNLSEEAISHMKADAKISAIAVGPGWGKSAETVALLRHLLNHLQKPIVLDADALNIIAEQPDLLLQLPPKSIITPHPKEFERLFGQTNNSAEMLQLAQEMAVKHQLIIVLKGAYTRILTSEGKVYINSTGNAGMATGGSGDVLTGIIASLLAQAYEPENAAQVGVYLHGLAADIALETESTESMVAGDIVKYLGRAFAAK